MKKNFLKVLACTVAMTMSLSLFACGAKEDEDTKSKSEESRDEDEDEREDLFDSDEDESDEESIFDEDEDSFGEDDEEDDEDEDSFGEDDEEDDEDEDSFGGDDEEEYDDSEYSSISSDDVDWESGEKFPTVKAYVESDLLKEQLEPMVEALEEAGLLLEVRADGDTLVYSYTYAEIENSDELADSIVESLDAQEATIDYVIDSLKLAVDVENPAVAYEYFDCNGEKICYREYE